jgi:hypothetical protein
VPCWPRLVLLLRVVELLGLGEILVRFGLIALLLVGRARIDVPIQIPHFLSLRLNPKESNAGVEVAIVAIVLPSESRMVARICFV